jgi:hypothetical protein
VHVPCLFSSVSTCPRFCTISCAFILFSSMLVLSESGWRWMRRSMMNDRRRLPVSLNSPLQGQTSTLPTRTASLRSCLRLATATS